MMEICDVDYKYQLLTQGPDGIWINRFLWNLSRVSSGIAMKKFEFEREGGDGTIMLQ